jgi:hypothetical protein
LLEAEPGSMVGPCVFLAFCLLDFTTCNAIVASYSTFSRLMVASVDFIMVQSGPTNPAGQNGQVFCAKQLQFFFRIGI